MRAIIKHHMNPLHVYCLLMDLEIGKGAAMFPCKIYDSTLFKHFLLKKPKMH